MPSVNENANDPVRDAMRGKVGLESGTGEGTRFWLELGRVPPKN